MAGPYRFQAKARSLKSAAIICAVWVVLLVLWINYDAAPWLVALMGAFTLPALWGFAQDNTSSLELSAHDMRWSTGRRSASVALDEIDHMRLDTRLDLSVRATAVLKTGRKLRLPFECTPPHMAFETELQNRGIDVRRHHFQLRQ